ncbi:hypothetical protein C8T65DRAFT_747687 [Cerioporus squamosus]|nr:hypothetical protein C8T65DRAFT_747687 [Cerioporus squamosus]
MDGSAVQTFAALPGNWFLYLPPEYIDPHFDDQPIVSNIASWITSGTYLTSPAAFLQHYYRTMCKLNYHLTQQVPDKAKMHVDFKELAECFSMVDNTGATIQPDFWELHPGVIASSSTLGCTQKEAIVAWDAHKLQQGKYIPHVVHPQLEKKKRGCKKQKAPWSEGDDYDGDVDDDEDSSWQHPRKHRRLEHQENFDNDEDPVSSDEILPPEGAHKGNEADVPFDAVALFAQSNLQHWHLLPCVEEEHNHVNLPSNNDILPPVEDDLTSANVSLNAPAMKPHFQPMLDLFGLDKLRQQLHFYQALAKDVELGGNKAGTYESIQAFM